MYGNLKPKSHGKYKADVRWESGVWLGIRDKSSEGFIGTERRAIKVRTVRRKGTKD